MVIEYPWKLTKTCHITHQMYNYFWDKQQKLQATGIFKEDTVTNQNNAVSKTFIINTLRSFMGH